MILLDYVGNTEVIARTAYVASSVLKAFSVYGSLQLELARNVTALMPPAGL
jgi:hypothetical protein